MHKKAGQTSVEVSMLCGALLAGCVRFTPLPLPNRAELLTPPDMAGVRVAANSIAHPLLPPIHFDERDGLSPDEAAVLAVLLNPQLRVDRDERGTAAAQLLQAGLLPNPELSATWEAPDGGDTADATTGFGVGLDWDVRRLITRAVRQHGAMAHAEAVDLSVAWREWQTAEAAKRQVYRIEFARLRIEITRKIVKRLHAKSRLLERAVGRGLKTELDAAAANASEREARAVLVDAEQNAATERLVLNRLLGLPPDTWLRTVADLSVPHRLDLLPKNELLRDLENRRLDLMALRRGYESRNARLRAVILEQFPRVRVGLSQARETDRLNSLAVGVSVELPLFDRGQARIRLEQATRKRVRDEYAARVFNAVSGVAAELARIKAIENQLEAAEAAVVDLNKLRNACDQAVRQGRMDLLRASGATTRYLKKQLEVLGLEEQLGEARIALELLSGRYRVTRDTTQKRIHPPKGRNPAHGKTSE
ncbi:MAG: TolC family protein [Kiritimatiellaeota bacterium]|nr:TolC family protein [Kiritimatiellota bacterium]